MRSIRSGECSAGVSDFLASEGGTLSCGAGRELSEKPMAAGRRAGSIPSTLR